MPQPLAGISICGFMFSSVASCWAYLSLNIAAQAFAKCIWVFLSSLLQAMEHGSHPLEEDAGVMNE